MQVTLPILNGAAASLLSTLVMALGYSYVFVSFYKTMILVFVLGVLHSIVFLPVLLSFVGPRRTSRPQSVFFGVPSSGGGAGEEQPPQRCASVRGANCVQAVNTPSPSGVVEPTDGSPAVELQPIPEVEDLTGRASTAGSDGSQRASLFAGERDSLSGHEGRPAVVFVDRHGGNSNHDSASDLGQSRLRLGDRTDKS